MFFIAIKYIKKFIGLCCMSEERVYGKGYGESSSFLDSNYKIGQKIDLTNLTKGFRNGTIHNRGAFIGIDGGMKYVALPPTSDEREEMERNAQEKRYKDIGYKTKMENESASESREDEDE